MYCCSNTRMSVTVNDNVLQLSPFISQGVQSVINRMSHKIIHSIQPVTIIKPSEWEKPPEAKAWLGLAMERLALEFSPLCELSLHHYLEDQYFKSQTSHIDF